MTRTLRLAAALLGLAAAPALAGNVEDIRVALPELVELAEIQPGLQVVIGLDIEVFVQGGAWWIRSDGRWYATRRPLDTFQAVEPRAVPTALAGLPRGRYLEYRPAEGQKVVKRLLTPAPHGEGEGVPAEAAAPRPAAPIPLPPPPRLAAPLPAPAAAKPAAPAPRAQPKPQPKPQPKAPPAKKAPARPPPKPAGGK